MKNLFSGIVILVSILFTTMSCSNDTTDFVDEQEVELNSNENVGNSHLTTAYSGGGKKALSGYYKVGAFTYKFSRTLKATKRVTKGWYKTYDYSITKGWRGYYVTIKNVRWMYIKDIVKKNWYN